MKLYNIKRKNTFKKVKKTQLGRGLCSSKPKVAPNTSINNKYKSEETLVIGLYEKTRGLILTANKILDSIAKTEKKSGILFNTRVLEVKQIFAVLNELKANPAFNDKRGYKIEILQSMIAIRNHLGVLTNESRV